MRNERQIPIKEHLLELRKRLFYSSVAIFITTIIAFIFHEQILILLMEPAQGFAGIPGGKPIYTDLTEFISAAVKASLMVGIFSALPFVLFQLFGFIAPGLTPTERRYLYALLPAVIIVFLLGAAFGYRVLFPPAIQFLLGLGRDVAEPQIRIGPYVSLIMSLLLWMGVLFETPIVMFFLTKIGLVRPETFAKQRRYALVAAFVLGAVVTPSFDPINQTFAAVPIFILYETGIWLSKLAYRGRRRSLEEDSLGQS